MFINLNQVNSFINSYIFKGFFVSPCLAWFFNYHFSSFFIVTYHSHIIIITLFKLVVEKNIQTTFEIKVLHTKIYDIITIPISKNLFVTLFTVQHLHNISNQHILYAVSALFCLSLLMNVFLSIRYVIKPLNI